MTFVDEMLWAGGVAIDWNGDIPAFFRDSQLRQSVTKFLFLRAPPLIVISQPVNGAEHVRRIPIIVLLPDAVHPLG